MTDKTSRVIHNFGDRLAIDRALKALAQTRNAAQRDEQARALAAKGKPALSALLRYLGTDDPALRGGLGHLAQHLDDDLVIPALRQAAMDVTRPDAARLTAVMLLERYLGQEIDPGLAQRIPASYDVARESGVEAITMAETNPLVLVEYAEQLLDEPPEIVHAVVQIIKEMDDPRRAWLMKAVAAYGDAALQKELLDALGLLRHPMALQSLYTLQHLVAPELRPLARRKIQKLRLSGVQEPEPGQLRALWSPVNAQGHSLLWLIHTMPDDDHGDLLSVVLHDELGVVHAQAYPAQMLDSLPKPAPTGHTHYVRLAESPQRMAMVEIEPALALQRLQEALQIMLENDYPWPAEIVVFGNWFWHGKRRRDAQPTWPPLPDPAPSCDETACHALLEHQAFAGWVWASPELDMLLSSHSGRALSQDSPLHHRVIAAMLADENRQRISARLRQQALWLTLARESKNARLALAARQAVAAGDNQHPFIRKLVWRSLLAAVAEQAMRNVLKSVKGATP